MTYKNTSITSFRTGLARATAAVAFALAGMTNVMAVELADQPVFSTSAVPGNLALALSVEWPTASRTAHTDNYSASSEFLGYFDPNKCYLYHVDTTANSTNTGDTSYFYPAGQAVNHQCVGDNDDKWSGNFLNWASTATIDPFRWALTGGRRVVDTATQTILEQGWHPDRDLFPDRDLPVAAIPGATPFNATRLSITIRNMGFKMRLAAEGVTSRGLTAYYYNSLTPGGTPVLTVNDDNAYHDWGSGSPGAGVGNDNFSVRMSGTYKAPTTGNYRFRTRSDDGVRLWVDTTGGLNFNDSTRVIENWTDHGPAEDTTDDIYLTEGQSFSIQVDYYEKGGGAVMQLSWKRPTSDSYTSFSSGGNQTNDYTMRVLVCDPSEAAGGPEANCKRYGNNYKPEGLIQKYADRMRFSAFGYLNDSSDQRDGGVLRANQKFVGPTKPVPGSPSIDNGQKEWSATDGTFFQNPDKGDAKATTDATGVTISDSGVINYLNNFGQLIPGNYKDYDPVSEMYYAVMRYYRHLGNVDAWSKLGNVDAATKKQFLDGFPVITNWADPIEFSCQRNFVLGIGDIYTHVDKNVVGNTTYRTREPTMPTEVAADKTMNAITATNKVGALQGVGNIGSTNSYSGRDNSAFIAGMAYDANTKDIREDDPKYKQTIGKQTVQTYWVDVLEKAFEANNQFYLAAKYGGMKVPDSFDPYSNATTSDTIKESWWHTTTDMVGSQKRPDNYFTGGRPDTLIAGLNKAFEQIVAAIKAYTTSFSLSTAQVSESGSVAYASQYDSSDWSGVVTARSLTFTKDGTPSAVNAWESTSKMAAQFDGEGWDTNRRVVTWSGSAGVPFRTTTGGLTTGQKTDLTPNFGNDATLDEYVAYLRGDRSHEGAKFRSRGALLGDIVNAKVTPVGPPNSAYGDSLNPGYAAFKTAKRLRPTMVYVAANDGMVHAFNGAVTGDDAGKEQFAYVPSAAITGPNGTPRVDGLAQFGNPTNFVHHYFVDSTPVAFDIDMNYAGGGPFTTEEDGTNAKWRTVLIGGMGKGGRKYYAIDVTDPADMTTEAAVAGKVLWEFEGQDAGYSYGAPIVVRTKKYGWVVVFTSGYKDGDNSDNGYLYFVDPRDGHLLERVSTGASAPGLTYASAYVQDFAKYEADSIYVGDLNGTVWRFDLTAATGAYPAPIKLAQLTDGADVATAQPITTPPLIEISPTTRKRYILVGTGKLLAPSDINVDQEQSFYGILDGTAGAFSTVTSPITRATLTEIDDLTKGITLSDSSDGWYMDLGLDTSGPNTIGWRVSSPPAAFNGVLAFSSMLTTGDACSPSGQSRVYAINFTSGRTVLTSGAEYQSFTNSVTDLRFVSLNGRPLLIAGDNQGGIGKIPANLSDASAVKLLNWRELPTVE
ncbi:PilC/PilY family type IV pilus protein [Variovorax sp.]|uniref:PilC/PilY family type IV pilus protein n=1 Tax=Variovorax sp. TaxID=1871043 RepID=UPI002D2F4D58|nr:PilC/PilY family type IV pilus protein [Variovorax sp.]HYP82890.1 PilC/PilY family type IV pilus protein [Variovorax sp.]